MVSVIGEVDLFAAPRLAAALDQAADRPRPILVDLSRCTFLDSSGLHALLGAHLEARRSARRVVLACPPAGWPARLLQLAAPGTFAEHPSRDHALAALIS